MEHSNNMELKTVYAAITFGVLVIIALVYLTGCTASMTVKSASNDEEIDSVGAQTKIAAAIL